MEFIKTKILVRKTHVRFSSESDLNFYKIEKTVVPKHNVRFSGVFSSEACMEFMKSKNTSL